MYAITEETKAALLNGNSQRLKLTISGEESIIVVTEANIVSGSFNIDRHSTSSNGIVLGSASAADLQFTLANLNGEFDNFKFEGAEIYANVIVDDLNNSEAYVIPLGCFTIDNQPRKLSEIKITALDRMVLFDKTVDWNNLTFPMSVGSLVTNICRICNVSLFTQLSSLTNNDYLVLDKPQINGDITYRQLLIWACEIMACCSYFDENGQLRLQWYEETGETINENTRYSSDIYENDISISGIVFEKNKERYVSGSTEYAISITGNGLINDNVQEVIENIFNAVKETKYRPFQCSCFPLPYLYPLDAITFIDRAGNEVKTLITHVNFTLNGATSLKAVGETAQSRGYASVNPLTNAESVIIEQIRGEVNNVVNNRIQTILGFNELISNSMGLYSTTVKKENGSIQTYMHDAKSLEQSMTIYTMTEKGFAYTNSGWKNGNPTYQYGFDKFGNAIFNKVCAYGVEVSDPNSKYSGRITPEAFETYFGTMRTASFNGDTSNVRKMLIDESFEVGKILLLPHTEDGKVTGTDLVFLEG